jgi:hypothetical protein
MRRCRNLCRWPVNIGIVNGQTNLPFQRAKEGSLKPLVTKAEAKGNSREVIKAKADFRKGRQKESPRVAKMTSGVQIGQEKRRKGWTSAFSTTSKANARATVIDHITAQY